MSTQVYIPKNYHSLLNLNDTEHAIKDIKDFFQSNLSTELRLRRVTAPLFVLQGTGINDDLNGVERAVSFPIRCMGDARAEVVHSLAKWKRMMLREYEIEPGYGLYTDMNAIRPDEDLDNIHSLYVDQWDWERHISPSDYNLDFLKYVVRKIYEVMKRTEYVVYEKYGNIKPILPEEITIIHSEELLRRYPSLSPKEREDAICKEKKAVFVIGIGHELSHGEKHDGRASDYDDWSSLNSDGYRGLNGDILVWNDVLDRSFEISSMGIRVSPQALAYQLEHCGDTARRELMFHKKLLAGELPLSIGGGIGQSRLCMLFLRKAHIGEIQASIWPDDMRDTCRVNNIILV
ncbi:MAG: aspartate--ammonia ligase [Breznakibacter sp.]